jgi:hypothetical protein
MVETNPLVFWYGIIYVHQLRICHFLQTIWLIRRDITCDYCYEWLLMVMITITIDNDYH